MHAGDAAARPPYAMQVKRSAFEGVPSDLPPIPDAERQFVTHLGLWVAHDQMTVLELEAEGWTVHMTTKPLTWRMRLDLALGRVGWWRVRSWWGRVRRGSWR